jgi:hypothetical protein
VSAACTALLRYIKLKLIGLHEARLPDEYYYASLPLCVVDAVFSIGVRYESTRRTVRNWCDSQTPAWRMIDRSPRSEQRRSQHTLEEFLGLLKGRDFRSLAQREFNNSQRTSSTNGILKAEATYMFAVALHHAGINDFGDTQEMTRLEKVRPTIIWIKGQGSGLSFDYFLMLSGCDAHVKADRMVRRFVANALGTTDVSAITAQQLVLEACEELKAHFPNLKPRLLDYEIWSYQRARRSLSVA